MFLQTIALCMTALAFVPLSTLGLGIRQAAGFGETWVSLSAGNGVHLKGWPEQPGPNPTYDADWQSSRRFAMPSGNNGMNLPTIQHEGNLWALQVASLDGTLTAYCELRAGIVNAGADHSFSFSIVNGKIELSRCGCWDGLTMTCQSGAIGPGSKDLACGAVRGPC